LTERVLPAENKHLLHCQLATRNPSFAQCHAAPDTAHARHQTCGACKPGGPRSITTPGGRVRPQDPAEALDESPSLADDLAALGIASVDDAPPSPGRRQASAAADGKGAASDAGGEAAPLPLPHPRRFWLDASVALAPGSASAWHSLADWCACIDKFYLLRLWLASSSMCWHITGSCLLHVCEDSLDGRAAYLRRIVETLQQPKLCQAMWEGTEEVVRYRHFTSDAGTLHLIQALYI